MWLILFYFNLPNRMKHLKKSKKITITFTFLYQRYMNASSRIYYTSNSHFSSWKPKPADNKNLLMWRTEVLSKTFRIWGLCSSHHLLNIKTLTAMGYFWGTANFNNTLRYPTCSFKRKYYCKFWKNSSTWSIIRSLIFFWRELETNAGTLKQHLQIFLSWASAISGLSQQLYLGHSNNLQPFGL